MKILENIREKEIAKHYIDVASGVALLSTCKQKRYGCVIVENKKNTGYGEIIGYGYNSPPKDLETQRRCDCSKESYDNKVTDKTCCIHAEQRAIMNALRNNPNKIENSDLYFVCITKNGFIMASGNPYCTICSKMALDVGIKNFIYMREEGISIYGIEEYNNLSYNFRKEKK